MIGPVTLLEGDFVRLEPLRADHHGSLCAVGLDPDLWRWAPQQILTGEAMMSYVQSALRGAEEGRFIPFAIVLRETARVVGSTRFGTIDRENRRVEIGWTWIAEPWQRTAVNTETKLLMLRHAFDVWHCLRVEFKTDRLNDRSRAALLRLGAREEGTLRSHMVTATGRVRDSVYFSIIEEEWPGVRDSLVWKLGCGSRRST
jgi:RimJ/RimL family protein N-acetyltransferase